MSQDPQPQMGRLFGMIALFTLLGVPMVAFLWETLNRVMAGHFDLVRIGLSVPVLALFIVLLRFMARTTQRVVA